MQLDPLNLLDVRDFARKMSLWEAFWGVLRIQLLV